VKTVAKAMASRLAACAFCVALAACSLAGPADHTYLTASGQQITPAAPAQTSPWAGPGVPLTKNKKKKTDTTATPTPAPPAAPVDPGAALTAAINACKNATRDKGIKSVLAIVSHMRPGAVDEDYIACMKDKGYTVAK
jgi:hypothetical protein